MTRKASMMQPVIGRILANGKGAQSFKSAPARSEIRRRIEICPRQVSVEMKDFVSARKYYEEALKLEPMAISARQRKKRFKN